jgi:DNA-binding response OmpR family regulator
MRLLFVEDSERLQRSVGTGLKKAGYAVDITGDGEEGLWFAEAHNYDVIILDLMLPKLDGLSLLGKLRKQGKQTHILILTAKDRVEDKVLGLQQGADDYMVKPFSFDELLARIHALCRRAYKKKDSRIHLDDFELDTASRTVSRSGRSIALTPREYMLLEYLVGRKGEVVTRSEIEEHIYDEAADPNSNVVDSAVCALRKKITPAGSTSLIHTRRGMGYVFDLPS